MLLPRPTVILRLAWDVKGRRVNTEVKDRCGGRDIEVDVLFDHLNMQTRCAAFICCQKYSFRGIVVDMKTKRLKSPIIPLPNKHKLRCLIPCSAESQTAAIPEWFCLWYGFSSCIAALRSDYIL